MRFTFPLLLLFTPLAPAQTPDETVATLKFIASLRDRETGAYAVNPPKEGEKLKPSLRAINGAVKATKYLGGEVKDKEKLSKFVLSCYDGKNGTFAEPGGNPDVAVTSVGVITAVELGIPKEMYKKAMEYLKENAKEFEEVRIAAAAVEAFGVKESGIDLKPWVKIAMDVQAKPLPDAKDGGARQAGSTAAMILRLEPDPTAGTAKLIQRELRALNLSAIHTGQREDGGWGKRDAKASDAETTYLVMRALKLLGEKPKDVAGLNKFLASCRRNDGGYGVDAAAPSSMSGVYYFATVSHWLTEMEK